MLMFMFMFMVLFMFLFMFLFIVYVFVYCLCFAEPGFAEPGAPATPFAATPPAPLPKPDASACPRETGWCMVFSTARSGPAHRWSPVNLAKSCGQSSTPQ